MSCFNVMFFYACGELNPVLSETDRSPKPNLLLMDITSD